VIIHDEYVVLNNRKKIMESTSKNPLFKEAERHIGQENYFEALIIMAPGTYRSRTP
jgi:hypothetical protein